MEESERRQQKEGEQWKKMTEAEKEWEAMKAVARCEWEEAQVRQEEEWETATTKRKKRTTKRKKANFMIEVYRGCARSGCECEEKKLTLLQTMEPEGQIKVVEGEWEELHLAVDSGATETVVNAEEAKTVPTEPGQASKAGVKYIMANGDVIENEGEKVMHVSFSEGVERLITAQVTDVTKPLLSVSQMVRAGNTVVFSPEGSYIWERESGEYMEMEEVKGMYMLKVWVKKPSGFHGR